MRWSARAPRLSWSPQRHPGHGVHLPRACLPRPPHTSPPTDVTERCPSCRLLHREESPAGRISHVPSAGRPRYSGSAPHRSPAEPRCRRCCARRRLSGICDAFRTEAARGAGAADTGRRGGQVSPVRNCSRFRTLVDSLGAAAGRSQRTGAAQTAPRQRRHRCAGSPERRRY